MFFKGSRYAKVLEHQFTDASGRSIVYKRVRFTPRTEARRGHRVNQGERLDHLAHRYYRDAERFWRICDANDALWPDDLTAVPGALVGIPAAED